MAKGTKTKIPQVGENLPNVVTSQDVEKIREDTAPLSAEEQSQMLQEIWAKEHGAENELTDEQKRIRQRTLTPEEEARAMQLPQFQPSTDFIPFEQQQKSVMTDEQGKLQQLGNNLKTFIPRGLAAETPEEKQKIFEEGTAYATSIGVAGLATAAAALGAPAVIAGGASAIGTGLSKLGLGAFGKLSSNILSAGIALTGKEILDTLTGKKSNKLISNYVGHGNNVMNFLRKGQIDSDTAEQEINKINSDVRALKGTFKLGTRQLVASYTEGGQEMMIDIADLEILAANWQKEVADFKEEQRNMRRAAFAATQRPKI